jgi:hypothetical protein
MAKPHARTVSKQTALNREVLEFAVPFVAVGQLADIDAAFELRRLVP